MDQEKFEDSPEYWRGIDRANRAKVKIMKEAKEAFEMRLQQNRFSEYQEKENEVLRKFRAERPMQVPPFVRWLLTGIWS